MSLVGKARRPRGPCELPKEANVGSVGVRKAGRRDPTSSQKAPATHSPQPVRPRSDQGRVRPGSGCQGSGRPYPTGSWGGPGRDIVPGKVCFSTATPSRELCRTGMRKAAPGLGRGERRGPELGAGPGLGRRRDREPQAEDRGGAGAGRCVGGASGLKAPPSWSRRASSCFPSKARAKGGILKLTIVEKGERGRMQCW